MWGGGSSGIMGGGGGTSNDVSKQWVDGNYVSKDYFNQLFKVKVAVRVLVTDPSTTPETVISDTGFVVRQDLLYPNEVPEPTETTDEETGYKTSTTYAIDSIQVMGGLWTNSYLSALGQNSSGGGGGGGGSSTLQGLLDVNIPATMTQDNDGQVLMYDYAQNKWINATIQQSGGTVTSITAGTGLSGGTITGSGTIAINSTYQTYISHGETAYGWGNHANAGYALASNVYSKTEADGRFAKLKSANDMLHATNEFTFASAGFSGNIWLNYRTASGNKDGAIDCYTFGDGAGNALATITNGQFSGNADSATKLATARTLWGQSFDGTANVTGNMTNVGTISANGNITVTKTTSADTSVSVTNTNGTISLLASTNRGMYDTDTWVIATNGTNTWLSRGNVGIGTTTPGYKLEVNGTLKATKFYLSSSIYFELDANNHVHLVGAGFYSDSFISALGQNSSGGGGGGGSSTLAGLNDVALDPDPLTSANANDVLTYDGNGHWVNTSKSSFLNGYATESWVTGTALSGYATQSWVNTQISDMATKTWVNTQISDMATKTWVNTQISDMATKTWVTNQGYTTNTGTVTSITAGTGLSGGTITGSGTIAINSTYQTYISHGETAYGWGNHANAGYATQTWVTNKNYLTSVAFSDLTSHPTTLSGYGITDAVGNSTTWWGQSISNGSVSGSLTSVGSITSNTRGSIDGFNKIEFYSTTQSTGTGGGIYFHFPGVSGYSSAYIQEATQGILDLYRDVSVNRDLTVGQNIYTGGNYVYMNKSSIALMIEGGITDADTGETRASFGFHTAAGTSWQDTAVLLQLKRTDTERVVDVPCGILRIGDVRLVWDSYNNALKVIKNDGTAGNLYATGGVSALGMQAGVSAMDAMTFNYLKVNNRITLPPTIIAGTTATILRQADDSDCIYMLNSSANAKITNEEYYYNQYDNVGLRGTNYNYDEQWWIDPDGCARFQRLYLDGTRYLYVLNGTLYYYNGSTSKQVAFTN